MIIICSDQFGKLFQWHDEDTSPRNETFYWNTIFLFHKRKEPEPSSLICVGNYLTKEQFSYAILLHSTVKLWGCIKTVHMKNTLWKNALWKNALWKIHVYIFEEPSYIFEHWCLHTSAVESDFRKSNKSRIPKWF